jgi:hypothetical protein
VGGYALYYGLGKTELDFEAILHGSIIGSVGILFVVIWLWNKRGESR